MITQVLVYCVLLKYEMSYFVNFSQICKNICKILQTYLHFHFDGKGCMVKDMFMSVLY